MEDVIEESDDAPERTPLVLMDIDLGDGMDGVGTARRLLERQELPIVFLTSHTEPEYVERVREVTRYGYVLKTSGELILRLTMEMAVDLFEANQLARRQAEELETIYDHAPVVMFVVDRDVRIARVNRQTREFAGLDDSQPVSLGRILRCVRAFEDPALCGRFPECAGCGVRGLVAETLDSGTSYRDVPVVIQRVTSEGMEEREIRVFTTALEMDGRRHALVSFLELATR